MALPLSRMGAALAFYALFALPPVVVVALLVGGEVFGDAQAEARLLEQVEMHFGTGGRATVEGVVRHAPRFGEGELLTQVLSGLVLLYTSTVGFGHFQAMLNRIWQTPPRRTGVALLLQAAKRLFSFAFVVAFSLLLLGVATFGVALHLSPSEVAALLPEPLRPLGTQALEGALFLLVAFLGLGVTFQVLPDRRVPWRSALLGAATAALLLVALRTVLGAYLAHPWQSDAFGAAGALVGALFSFHAAAVVVLLGALVARVHATRREGAAKERGGQSAAGLSPSSVTSVHESSGS